MTLVGTGIMPASGAVSNELIAVTRRAFIPKLVVQNLYKGTPVLSAALANAQPTTGGVSSVTVPVQGTPFVTTQATDYSGSFNQPASLQGAYEASFNLKAIVCPIPFLGMEGLIQQDAAVIPLIEARMNDAGNSMAAYLATYLATNATNGTINVDGFPLFAAATGTYGNIDRTTNAWWQGATLGNATGSPTRATVLQDIIAAANANGGEMPNIGVCGPGTWTALAQDFVGQEQYQITPGSAFDASAQGPRAAFTALMVAGVPIYMDTNFPEGNLWLFHTRYFSAYIHSAAAFAFTGFMSTLANYQLGYIGAVVALLEFICTKPKSFALRPSYTPVSMA